MSTPKHPGPRLPERPAGPPKNAQDAGGPPSDTTSVLERLKAAQPRTAVVPGDGGTARSPGPGTGPRGKERSGTEGPGNDVPAPAGPRTGGPPTGDARRRFFGPGRAAAAPGTRRNGNADSDPDAAGRLRVAAAKARTAAGATGAVLGRGSSATVRRVGAWDPDLVRQSVVTVCAIACILGSAAGVGAFGGPSIRDAAGGLFAPDATLLAPSSTAFSIWSVIYAGLGAYTVYQWLPSQRRTPRQRRLGWTVAASMLLNLAWILSAQAGELTLSLVVIMLLFFTLLAAVRTMNDHPNQTRPEGALVDTPIGLYLGWVLLAAGANAAAYFTATDADLFGWEGTTWAILGVVTILMTAAVVCSTDRGRLAVAAATSWGLLWITVERALGQPYALPVAFVAALAIFLLLITAGSRRHRVDHAYRRWLRAQEDAQREPIDLLGEDYEDSRY